MDLKVKYQNQSKSVMTVITANFATSSYINDLNTQVSFLWWNQKGGSTAHRSNRLPVYCDVAMAAGKEKKSTKL